MAKAIRANNEFFDALAADVFTRLYTHFPEPIELLVDDEVISHIGIDEDPERLKPLYGATVRWMAAEGLIRIGEDDAILGTEGEEVFCDVVLSAKGLAALKEDSRGERLKNAIGKLGADAAKKLVTDVVGQIVRWAGSALG